MKLEPWQESYVLFMYMSQQQYYNGLYGNQKLSFEEYKDIITPDFFLGSLPIAYKAAYIVGYSNGYSDACNCKRQEY